MADIKKTIEELYDLEIGSGIWHRVKFISECKSCVIVQSFLTLVTVKIIGILYICIYI